jgi:biopolymer transport protein ExbB/TolQ
MNELTALLYWISTGLLIPVILVLLFLFIRVLMATGGFISLFVQRLKYEKNRIIWLENSTLTEIPNRIKQENPFFYPFLLRFVDSPKTAAHFEKLLSEFELEADKELAKVKLPARLGPMLGLMGTLIPMGPALVGLASGDIAGMAQNMQVAFSTTVVGIVIGALGYVLQLVKTRWYAQDLTTLEFLTAQTLENITKENEEILA